MGKRPGALLGRAGLAGGDPVQHGAGPLGDDGQELRLAVVVDGGDVLGLQLREAGGDLPAAPRGPTDQLVRYISMPGRRPGVTERGSEAKPRASTSLWSANAATVFSYRASVCTEL